MTRLYAICLSVLSLVAFVQYADGGSAGHRQHSAHEHGAGILHLVQEGDALYLELISPAANIVGFEHEPRTGSQKEAVRKAVDTLNDASRVFTPRPEAGCKIVKVEIDSGLMEDDHHVKNKENDEHHAHTVGADGNIHSEFHVKYRFGCDAPEKLTYVDVHLFTLFPGTEEIEAQLISTKGQTVRELTHRSTRLTF